MCSSGICVYPPGLPPPGRRRGCWGRPKTEKRLGTITLSHPQSDESSFQLNREAWGKGIRTDPLGAVPLLGAEIWAALSQGCKSPVPLIPLSYQAVAAYLCLRTPSAVAGGRRGLGEPHPWRLRRRPASPPPASSLRLSCRLLGTGFPSSLHSGPHFGSSLAPSSSGPQSPWWHPPSRFPP